MLDTHFPRIVGDIGNVDTWSFPVLYKIVEQATADQVVLHQAHNLLSKFIDAAGQLVAQGADGITTSCGFLSRFQAPLAAAVNVPVASSSLLQVAMVQAMLPSTQTVGVITISSDTLTKAHLEAANVPLNTPIVGTDNGRALTRVILNDETDLDVEKARTDVIDAGRRLLEENSQVGAIVLECTNMAPYAADLQFALGVPVYSIVSFINWFHAGLSPARFD